MRLLRNHVRLARNRDTHPLILAGLLMSPLPWVAAAAASNPRAPTSMLRAAAAVRGHDSVEALLANPTLDEAGLVMITRRRGAGRRGVLAGVTRHRAAGIDAWTAVLRHPDVDIYTLTRIAEKPLPSDLLDEVARHRLTTIPFGHGSAILVGVAQNEGTAAGTLAWLAARCEHEDVLAAVAGNPNTAEDDAVLAALRSMKAA